MVSDIDLKTLKETFLPYLQELKDLHFSFLNPLFWAGLLALCLILLRYWEAKKSFSFCVTIGIILLATTKVEAYLVAVFTDTTVAFLTRIISVFIISLIFLYYAFMKES